MRQIIGVFFGNDELTTCKEKKPGMCEVQNHHLRMSPKD